MTNDFYKQALNRSLKELSDTWAQREEIQKQVDALDERVEKLRQGALALAALADIDFDEVKKRCPDLFQDQIDPRIGITEAVREALRSSEITLSPYEIRNRVFEISPAVAGHKNPMASIHAVLRRLVDNVEVIMSVDKEERTYYGWIGSDDAEARIVRWFPNPEEALERVRRKRERKAKRLAKPKKSQESAAEYKPVTMVDEKGKLKKVVK